MLHQLTLRSFKCFRDLELPLAPLTLLSGRNASGKSSVIQALTLTHQSAVTRAWTSGLILDGPLLSLGTAGDVLDKLYGRSEFSIGLKGTSFACEWTYRVEERHAIEVPIARARLIDTAAGHVFDEASPFRPSLRELQHDYDGVKELVVCLESMGYLSAERLGPRETYSIGTQEHHQWVGARGERAVGTLHYFGDRAMEPKSGLRVADLERPLVLHQVKAWLGRFFPGAQLDLRLVPGANLATLGLRTSEDTDFHRPQNVGYGLTHILPILIACLKAQPGEVILLENPEVHLHPAGQSLMGQFLARVAADGVQVVVETHSDHVLNGVRRAVRDGQLKPEETALHFFNPRSEAAGSPPQVISPVLSRQGQIDAWPAGFFDQMDHDLSYLAGWES